MAISEPTESDQEPCSVQDLLDPEHRQDFKYIYGRLIAHGRKRGLTFQEAEDLAQDALFRAWGRRHRYTSRPGSPQLAWLLKVAQNLFIDRMRTKQVKSRVLEEMAREQGGDCSTETQLSSLVDAEATRRRDRLLLELPQDLQEVFSAWIEQQERGISRDKAADQLGISIDEFEAAKKRVRRAVQTAMDDLGYKPGDLWSTGAHDAAPRDQRRR